MDVNGIRYIALLKIYHDEIIQYCSWRTVFLIMGYVCILIDQDLTKRPKMMYMGEEGDGLKNG